MNGDTASLIRTADEARDQKRWPAARDSYRKALDHDPSLAHIWVQYGHALKESGEISKAEEAYLEAIRLDPSNADSNLQLGHARKLLGRTRAAAEAYVAALRLDPTLRDARTELMHLGWTKQALRNLRTDAGTHETAVNAGTAMIALELSDLVDFLQGQRYPTGIQRVQLALAEGMSELLGDDRLMFVYFDHGRYGWTEIDRDQLSDIIDLVQDSHQDEETRKQSAGRLRDEIRLGASVEFPSGCHLINPGTSWGYWNYFLAIRDAKRRYDIRFAPLVHDCIPLIFPEFCNPNLVKDFINWISLAFEHADFILANSENTKRDVLDVVRRLNTTAPPIEVVWLNGEFRQDSGSEADRIEAANILRRHNLDAEEFVLFVSTIEPRKNHTLALNAWSRMLKAEHSRPVPRLVCVGNSGWMNSGFYDRLERDEALRERVLVLNNISDQALSALYDTCLFTLFPSLYEGWGLPITEALAHGKVPLVSRVSSHPEAGGEHAVYFDLHSEADFLAKVRELIDDVDGRREREERISRASPLRPWRLIGEQIADLVRAFPSDALRTHRQQMLSPIQVGRLHSFARNTADRLVDCRHSADSFRIGMGWHAPEPWGCWIRETTGDIGFELPEDAGEEVLIYLGMTAGAATDNTVRIDLLGTGWSRKLQLPAMSTRWEVISLKRSGRVRSSVTLRLRSEKVVDLSAVSEGRDGRRISIGVLGLYVCDAKNPVQRQDMIEALSIGNFERILRRFDDAAII